MLFRIFFFTLSNTDVDFLDWELRWRTYITKEVFSTIRHVKLVSKKEFAAIALDLKSETCIIHITLFSFVALPSSSSLDVQKFAAVALDLESETFVVHVVLLSFATSPSSSLLNIHPSRRPQIAGLITKKASTKIFNKYIDFADVFSPDLAFKLPEYTKINNHAIELLDGQQLSYRPIYSLGLVELKTPKAYIEINLANKFIRPSKSPVSTAIFFNRELDRAL